jgi:hypothetical protein
MARRPVLLPGMLLWACAAPLPGCIHEVGPGTRYTCTCRVTCDGQASVWNTEIIPAQQPAVQLLPSHPVPTAVPPTANTSLPEVPQTPRSQPGLPHGCRFQLLPS